MKKENAGLRLIKAANAKEVSVQELFNCLVPKNERTNQHIVSQAELATITKDTLSNEYNIGDATIVGSHFHSMGNATKEDVGGWYDRLVCIYDLDVVQEISDSQLRLTAGFAIDYKSQSKLANNKKNEQVVTMFMGFQNNVCMNMCISSEGISHQLIFSSPSEFAALMKNNVQSYTIQMKRQIELLRSMEGKSMPVNKFEEMLGRELIKSRMGNAQANKLTPLNSTQWMDVASLTITDRRYRINPEDKSVSAWQAYNLMTEAAKNSQLDSVVSTLSNCTKFVAKVCLN
jgi:hypothetical protein